MIFPQSGIRFSESMVETPNLQTAFFCAFCAFSRPFLLFAVACDQELLQAAAEEGFATVDPTTNPPLPEKI
jgi:hypothetical protein